MRIGIIGPTEIEEKARKIIIKVAKVVAKSGNDIIVTPDKGSCSELFCQEYKKAGGKKVIAIIPRDDKEFGYSWVNTEIADEEINCKTWENQPETLDKQVGSDGVLICFGLSPGALIEVAYTKWFKVKKVYLIKGLCDKLPAKTQEKVPAEYISASNLVKLLTGK